MNYRDSRTNRIPARLRRVLGVAALAACVALPAGALAVSAGGPWVIGPDGMMMPDPNPHETPVGKHGNTYGDGGVKHGAGYGGHAAPVVPTYSFTQSGSSYTIVRNGQPWLTLTPDSKAVTISDPNAAQRVVITVSTSKKY